MLDFACRPLEMDQMLKCGLGLTKAELSILHHFLKNCRREMASEEISKEMGLDLTTVQKAVKKLHGRSAISRFQRNLGNGGYLYLYRCNSRQEIRELLKKTIRLWVGGMENAIDRW